MARTDNLTNFLTDVASAIKTKKGDETPILASNFDTEIINLPSGGEKFAPEFVSFREYTGSTLNLDGLDTSNITNMKNMFYQCNNLTTLDVSHLDTSKATDMRYMFSFCSNLKTLDVSHFDTSKVIYMNSMFYGCRGFTEIDVSNFNTSKVIGLSNLFNGCSSLKNVDLSMWNPVSLTEVLAIFDNCSSLVEVKLFDTSKITNISTIFRGCRNLTTVTTVLDLNSTADTSSAFFNCSKLSDVKIKNLRVNLEIHYSPLSAESVDYLLNNVRTVSGKTINLGTDNLAKASEEAKANATSKGWTLK